MSENKPQNLYKVHGFLCSVEMKMRVVSGAKEANAAFPSAYTGSEKTLPRKEKQRRKKKKIK